MNETSATEIIIIAIAGIVLALAFTITVVRVIEKGLD